ncbi:acid phosphatase 1 [Selaginella moellendorffii]|uniref:acid phosphatase 1 n=1 Tax=Selaginella moellendorffii TaxID=88036 RepID=UPI000D1CF9AC|nr:acid phosphatase 1 [Selaginella moellendorffii]|eukprot:XP_024540857.1 acid phosphatase 1 [Selaginella moellendorffii]
MKFVVTLFAALHFLSTARGQSLHHEELVSARDPSTTTLSRYCSSFQFNAEVNNFVNGWLVPGECVSRIKRYIEKGQYAADVEAVINQARIYVKNLTVTNEAKKAWVLDIDETSLSNVPYYRTHSYGATKFNATEFNAWVDQASAAALAPTLSLVKELVSLRWNVIFITGRPESQRQVTVKNLKAAGYKGWTKLLLKSAAQTNARMTAMAYKSSLREGLVKDGYEIWGNIGDQWSDISGSAAGNKVFKLPNPLYFIP